MPIKIQICSKFSLQFWLMSSELRSARCFKLATAEADIVQVNEKLHRMSTICLRTFPISSYDYSNYVSRSCASHNGSFGFFSTFILLFGIWIYCNGVISCKKRVEENYLRFRLIEWFLIYGVIALVSCFYATITIRFHKKNSFSLEMCADWFEGGRSMDAILSQWISHKSPPTSRMPLKCDPARKKTLG